MSQNKMSLYTELLMGDVLSPIVGQLQSGRLRLHANGKITESTRLAFERPWLTAVVDRERNCSKWLEIYFKIYKIIPKGCRNCWKIAFRPKTLEDAFKVLELQKEMGINSKTGLERRGKTGNKGGYASFWYADLSDGLEEAREIYSLVIRKLNEVIGYADGTTLKRGCTEMEQFSNGTFGNSSQWDSREKVFDMTEKLLDTVFEIPELYKGDMPQMVTNFIKINWIEWAYEHGDETYLKFTDGQKMVTPPFNYMALKNQTFEVPLTWEAKDGTNSKSALETLV